MEELENQNIAHKFCYSKKVLKYNINGSFMTNLLLNYALY